MQIKDYLIDSSLILSSNNAKRNITVIPIKNPLLITRKRFNLTFPSANNVGS